MQKAAKEYYIITIIIDVILLPVVESIIPVYFGGNADIPFSMVVSFPFIPIICLIISIIGFKKTITLPVAILMKGIFILALYGISFLGFDNGLYAFVLFEILSMLVIVVLIGYVYSIKNRGNSHTLSSNEASKNLTGVPLKLEFRYKGKYVWDDAAAEYLRKTGKKSLDELTDTDNDRIYDFSMMPVVYYFHWLLKKGFMSESFYEIVGNGRAEDCVNGYVSPVELLSEIDYALTEDDLLPGILPFTESYFEPKHYSLYGSNFLYDYWDEIENGDLFYYVVDFDWSVCKKLSENIERAYTKWNLNEYNHKDYYEDDNGYGEVYSKRINGNLTVYRQGIRNKDNISDEYIQKCVEDFDTMAYSQLERFDRWFSDDYGDDYRGCVMDFFFPSTIHIFEPLNEGDLVYVIDGGYELDPEHGICFYVRNGTIYHYGYAYDFEDPYFDDMERKYSIALNDTSFIDIRTVEQAEQLLHEGGLVRTMLLPASFGGTNDESNMIYITPEVLKEKEILDRHLRAIVTSFAGRIHFKYDVIYYDDDVIVPRQIYVYHDRSEDKCRKESRSLFALTLTIWL